MQVPEDFGLIFSLFLRFIIRMYVKINNKNRIAAINANYAILHLGMTQNLLFWAEEKLLMLFC